MSPELFMEGHVSKASDVYVAAGSTAAVYILAWP
jgi:hypothetical protein